MGPRSLIVMPGSLYGLLSEPPDLSRMTEEVEYGTDTECSR